MRCVAKALMAVCLMVSPVALAEEVSDRFTIKGEYLSAEQSPSKRTHEEGMMDVAQSSVSISRREFSENGQAQSVVLLASGRFVDGKITLESQIDAPTEVQILVQTGTDQSLQTEALILRGSGEVSFALMDREGLEADQLLLVGESKRAKDRTTKFSISCVYDLEEGVEALGYLSASLTSFEYHRDGTPNQIEFGTALLGKESYLIEADVLEPRVGKLTIYRGNDFVWSSPVVMEPGGEVNVARRGPGNWLIANSKEGRHTKLYDSWHMNEEFLAKGQAMVSAPANERMSHLQDIEKMRMKALRDFAMNLEEPFNSLIALELARERYFPDSDFSPRMKD